MYVLHCVPHIMEVLHCLPDAVKVLHCVHCVMYVLHCVPHIMEMLRCVPHAVEVLHCVMYLLHCVPHIMEVPPTSQHQPIFYISHCSSGFQNYEGMINWAFLLLGMGGIRLFLENVNK